MRAAVAAVLALTTWAAVPAAPAADEQPVPHTIRVEPGAETAVRERLDEMGVEPTYTFDAALDGFVAELTAAQAGAVEQLTEVEDTLAAQPMSVSDTQPRPPWNLDRLDQPGLPLDGAYRYPEHAGAGVPVYVIDTGVTPNAREYGNRLLPGADLVADTARRDVIDDDDSSADCNGHGTHVAGTVASASYGVAKAATIVPLQALDCDGTGESTSVVAAVDWAIAHHDGGPGVINLSLTGPTEDPALTAATDAAIAAGITVVVAAGNDDRPAAQSYPGNLAQVVTVGASTRSDARWSAGDGSGSNYGTAVDLFAPGADIVSLGMNGGAAVSTGTSMAAPHVSGAAALHLAAHPATTPAEVEAALLAGAAPVQLARAGAGSPSRVLNVHVAADAATGSTAVRLGGADRYETSAVVSRRSFAPGVPLAIVATGLGYADALAGAAAAGGHGPVLLTAPDSLPGVVGRELDRLRPGRIVVVGGPGAVSDAVVAALRAYTTGSVVRVGGADRYDTAVRLSAASFGHGVEVAYVATGLSYADALAGAAAAGGRGPVLLTPPGAVPTEVAKELERLRPRRVVILGGAGAVSDSVASGLRTRTGRAVERIGGGDRFATAANVSRATFPEGAEVAYLATGSGYADALAGAAAASGRGPVLLVHRHELPAVVGAELQRLGPERVVVLGGANAVSPAVFAEAVQLLER